MFAAGAAKGLDPLLGGYEKIPKLIKDRLIDEAQANLEAFKNCASGKMGDLYGNSTLYIDRLVEDTNKLIKAGLLNQAQENIHAFVNCSTSKANTMEVEMRKTLDRLIKDWQDATAKYKEALEKGLSEEAAMWKERADNILKKVNQIQAWLDMLRQHASKPIVQKFIIKKVYSGREAKGGEEEGKYTHGFPAGGGETPSEGVGAPGSGGLAGGVTLQHGGIVTRPTFALLGERGPEAVIPLRNMPFMPPVTINFNVEGSVDRKTADYVIERVKRVLRNVIVEASSSGAPTMHKRIRLGSIMI